MRRTGYVTRPAARSYGFTLIELCVVCGIIGLLASLLLPALWSAHQKARATMCASNLRQIGMGFQAYLDDYGEIFPLAEDPVNTAPSYWLWMGRGWRPLLSPYVGREEWLFWCPVDTISGQVYAGTSYAYSMSFYHSPEQINQMTTPAATYMNPVPSVAQYLARVKTPHRKILAGEWLSNHRRIDDDKGWWAWDGRRNYLFVDGRVECLEAASLLPANDGLPDPNLTQNGVRGHDIP